MTEEKPMNPFPDNYCPKPPEVQIVYTSANQNGCTRGGNWRWIWDENLLTLIRSLKAWDGWYVCDQIVEAQCPGDKPLPDRAIMSRFITARYDGSTILDRFVDWSLRRWSQRLKQLDPHFNQKDVNDYLEAELLGTYPVEIESNGKSVTVMQSNMLDPNWKALLSDRVDFLKRNFEIAPLRAQFFFGRSFVFWSFCLWRLGETIELQASYVLKEAIEVGAYSEEEAEDYLRELLTQNVIEVYSREEAEARYQKLWQAPPTWRYGE